MTILETIIQTAGDWLRDLALGMLGDRAQDYLNDVIKRKGRSKDMSEENENAAEKDSDPG